MAGSKLNVYAVGDVNLTNMMASLNATTKGFHQVSLTEWETTTVPQIAAGSIVECDGALFSFSSDESISGSPSDGTVYIKLIPDGTSITAEFTNTAPGWDTAKQGWYSPTTGEETYRYLEYYIVKSSTTYYKYYYDAKQPLLKRIYTSAIATNSDPGPFGSGAKIVFSNIITDSLSEYYSAGTCFKAKKAGNAVLNVSLNIFGIAPSDVKNNLIVYILRNGGNEFQMYGHTHLNPQSYTSISFSRIINLSVGDTIEIYAGADYNTYTKFITTGSRLEIFDLVQ